MRAGSRRVLVVTGPTSADDGPDVMAQAAAAGFELISLATAGVKPTQRLTPLTAQEHPAWTVGPRAAAKPTFDVDFARLLRNESIDVVHFMDEKASLPIRLVERCFHQGVPSVVTLRNGRPVPQWKSPLVERALALAGAVLAPGEGATAPIHYDALVGDIAPPDVTTSITVVVTTYNRPDELRACLAGIADQTLDRSRYDVVVVDDSSSTDPAPIVDGFRDVLSLIYVRHEENRGLGAARNSGVERATGDIVFFVDDDDIPTPRALAEALRTHSEHPEPMAAVLGFVGWSPDLSINNVMYHTTIVGKQYLAYTTLTPGVPLPWHCAWGGATSFKTDVLREHPYKVPWMEDVDLSWRLEQQGLQVFYNPRSVQHISGPVNYAQFSQRMFKHGGAAVKVAALYPELADFLHVNAARDKLAGLTNVDRAEQAIAKYGGKERLDLATSRVAPGNPMTAEQYLDLSYQLAFEYHRLRGVAAATDPD